MWVLFKIAEARWDQVKGSSNVQKYRAWLTAQMNTTRTRKSAIPHHAAEAEQPEGSLLVFGFTLSQQNVTALDTPITGGGGTSAMAPVVADGDLYDTICGKGESAADLLLLPHTRTTNTTNTTPDLRHIDSLWVQFIVCSWYVRLLELGSHPITPSLKF